MFPFSSFSKELVILDVIYAIYTAQILFESRKFLADGKEKSECEYDSLKTISLNPKNIKIPFESELGYSV